MQKEKTLDLLQKHITKKEIKAESYCLWKSDKNI